MSILGLTIDYGPYGKHRKHRFPFCKSLAPSVAVVHGVLNIDSMSFWGLTVAYGAYGTCVIFATPSN